MKKDLINELEWRGLLNNVANEENLDDIINSKSSFYVGIDPTSDSLHIGHYMVISLAKIIASYNMRPVFVIGGFTGSIGDPSGKNLEREVISEDVIDSNSKLLAKQITILVEKAGISDFKIWNNKDLYNKMSIIELFQKYGKHFNVNTMLSREIISKRIENGISFTEFSYQIFQAIDFLTLYKKENVRMQIAGSDQWGNIVSGMEIIRKLEGVEAKVSGITVNLITDKNGNKIGKSEGKPIWLNNKKTSEYSFFQYIFNLSDELSETLLKSLTNISKEDFEILIKKHKSNPKERVLQNDLAKRIMGLIYDENSFDNAKNTSSIVFNEEYSKLSNKEAIEIFSDLKQIDYSKNLIESILNNKILNSKREYRDLINVGAIKVNGISIKEEEIELTDKDYINNQFIIINIGKKNKYIIWKEK